MHRHAMIGLPVSSALGHMVTVPHPLHFGCPLAEPLNRILNRHLTLPNLRLQPPHLRLERQMLRIQSTRSLPLGPGHVVPPDALGHHVLQLKGQHPTPLRHVLRPQVQGQRAGLSNAAQQLFPLLKQGAVLSRPPGLHAILLNDVMEPGVEPPQHRARAPIGGPGSGSAHQLRIAFCSARRAAVGGRRHGGESGAVLCFEAAEAVVEHILAIDLAELEVVTPDLTECVAQVDLQ
mmetsp:Transcript_44631/g.75115  ORF Transcript_44631/g.75115 Transcript_44631/m.75115 type:complete len:234 (+) Transcript_44631:1238-1939(+)